MKPNHFCKSLLTGLIALFFCSALLAQANFVPGSVTLANGEKLQGLIDYREWTRHPKKIVYKSGTGAEAKEFKPIELKYFEVTGKDRYESAIVKMDMESLLPEVNERPEGIPSIVTDTVFLRIIYEGALFNLYNFRDEKNRFYTRDSVNGYRELSFGQILVNNEQGREFKQTQELYKNQLMQYATDFDRLSMLRSKAERLRYSENSLLAFTRLLHNDTKKVEASERRLYFFAGAGANLSGFTLKDHILLDGIDLKSSFSPMVSLGFDFFAKRKRSPIFLRVEVNYFQMKTAGEKTTVSLTNEIRDYTYRISVNTISPSLTGFFTLYNKSSVRVYAGPSIAFNFSSYPNQLFTEKVSFGSNISSSRSIPDYFTFENSWANLHARAGVMVKNKWQVDISRNVLGGFSRYILFNFSASIFQARIAYRF